MTQEAFRELLRTGKVEGWFLFAGEEEYLKKYYRNQLRQAICPDEGFAPFNHLVFDGQTTSVADLRDAIETQPMMADHKLVEWRYPDLFRMREGDRKDFFELFSCKEQYPYTVFLLYLAAEEADLGTEKRRTKEYRALAEHFQIIEYPKSGDTQLLSWLKKHFDAEGIAVDRQVLEALIFRSGHGMETLNHEVEKLSAYARANGMTALDVATVELIASPTLECDAFALSGAISDRSKEKAFLALEDMKQRRIEPLNVLATLSRSYAELLTASLLLDEGMGIDGIGKEMKFSSPYRTKMVVNAAKKQGTARLSEALDRLSRADAAAKSGGVADYGVIERFIAEML